MSATAIYDAAVTHVRRSPLDHRFRYRTFYWLVDVDDPPRLPLPLRPLARFCAPDHLDVRALLAEHGVAPARLLMLANARMLGYVFNPISVYWAYDDAGTLVATVAEVHNTYGGRHAYVLHPDPRGRSQVTKELYVSPFHPVDGHYDIRVSPPGEQLSVAVTLRRPDGTRFVATLTGRRHDASVPTLMRVWLRYPWAPLRTSALIRWQGIRLWRRGLEVQPR